MVVVVYFNQQTIKVGNEIVSSTKNAKLLGITIDDNQKWKTNIYGKGGLIPSLNSRLFMIKRLSNELDNTSLKQMADSFYISKLRYGLPLFGKIRWNTTDLCHKEFEDLQVNQNNLLQFLNRTRISDKIKTAETHFLAKRLIK